MDLSEIIDKIQVGDPKEAQEALQKYGNAIEERILSKIGNLDETIQPKSGTILRLSGFGYRHVPAMDDFERQLAQRFGLSSGSWQIKLADNTKQPTPAQERSVGQFQLGSIEENTTIKLELLAGKDGSNGKEDYRAVGPVLEIHIACGHRLEAARRS